MTNKALAKALQCWRPLKVGRVVESVCGYQKGVRGVIEQKHDELLTGFARYGVRMDSDRQISDFCRFEIKPLKDKNRRPMRAPIVRP